jgi:methyltransferase (TIGR00027 family)
MAVEKTFDDISDTSRWVAMYRAMETERTDAHFQDPYARRLAGEKGELILRDLKNARASSWAPIVRTCIFDEIILDQLRSGEFDAVLNLAAGLDSRPYRLDLPPDLLWVEVDFPAIINHKNHELRNDRPRCRLERIAADLSDDATRTRVLADLGARGRKFLVLTEGLLIYLPDAQALRLGRDLAAQPSFQSWLIDLTSPDMLKFLQRSWGQKLGAAAATMVFAPAASSAFFDAAGWVTVQKRSFLREGARLKRLMPFAPLFRLASWFMPRKMLAQARDLNGVFLLDRNDSPSKLTH